MRKRLSGAIIAVILIVNGLPPADFSCVPAYGSAADGASIQLPLFQLCSSVRSPFRTMNSLVGHSLPLYPEFSSPLKTGKTADAAAGYACSLTSPGIRAFFRNGPGSPAQGGAAGPASDRCFSPPDPPLPPGDILCLFLLVYLVLLSRSNLPWALRDHDVKFFARRAVRAGLF